MAWVWDLALAGGRGVARWAAFFSILALSGCGPPRAKYPAALNAERPEQRIWAIRQAAERQDHEAIGILVERLEDDDEAVRFYAILALERLTGTRLGYNYHASETERHRAVERWRQSVRRGMQPELYKMTPQP